MDQIKQYIDDLQFTLGMLPIQSIDEAVEALHEARLQKQHIFVLGNGGSASTASHMVCDLAKNTRLESVPHIRIMEVMDNSAVFSAYANDEGYENALMNHLANFVEEGDIVIGISTSGKSPNILQAINYSNSIGALTIGLTGFDGGVLKDIVGINIHVPSNCIEQVEDIHLVLGHIFCTKLRTLAANLLQSQSPVQGD